jgi:DNA (cytosine-5)-methyltransferase 1
MYRAKIEAGEMTEMEAEAILGKSVWLAQGALPMIWPTPTTQEVEHPQAELTETGRRKSKNGNTSHSLGLADAVQMWPTPVASDAWTGDLKSTQQTEGSRHSLNLSTAVLQWPTPTANGWGSTGHRAMLDKQITQGFMPESDKLPMTAGNGGRLNPTWVEWLMGFPTGWTDLED